MKKRIMFFVAASLMLLTLVVPAFAANVGSGVASDAQIASTTTGTSTVSTEGDYMTMAGYQPMTDAEIDAKIDRLGTRIISILKKTSYYIIIPISIISLLAGVIGLCVRSKKVGIPSIIVFFLSGIWLYCVLNAEAVGMAVATFFATV